MTDTKQEQNRAKEQAKAQLESIMIMAKRLEHIQECNGEDCELTDQEMLEGINIFYEEGMTASEQDKEEYHNEDDVRQSMDEDPLSIEVRSDWHRPGENDEPGEYMILLCTGGPACRIIGGLDRGQPDNANLEYQDWFTPWEQYHTNNEEGEALLTYARHFYFGD